jgi:hypothetical protein
VTIALVAMLLLARLMVRSGMTEALAEAAADSTASAWPVLAPFVGVLGTFVTGSATASNVLFTDLQVATAEKLGYPTLTLLGAQNVGAAVGNPIAPHNIVAGGATVGLVGAEAPVMRGTILTVVGYALLGGLSPSCWSDRIRPGRRASAERPPPPALRDGGRDRRLGGPPVQPGGGPPRPSTVVEVRQRPGRVVEEFGEQGRPGDVRRPRRQQDRRADRLQRLAQRWVRSDGTRPRQDRQWPTYRRHLGEDAEAAVGEHRVGSDEVRRRRLTSGSSAPVRRVPPRAVRPTTEKDHSGARCAAATTCASVQRFGVAVERDRQVPALHVESEPSTGGGAREPTAGRR